MRSRKIVVPGSAHCFLFVWIVKKNAITFHIGQKYKHSSMFKKRAPKITINNNKLQLGR